MAGGISRIACSPATGEERAPGRIGHTVAVVADRVDGTVVEEALLGQHVEGPEGAPDDAEGGCPVADDGLTGDLLQNVLALPEVVAELLGGHLQDAPVVPAVAGDLVPGLVDVEDEVRVIPGQLTDDEERRPDPVPGELIEQPAGESAARSA